MSKIDAAEGLAPLRFSGPLTIENYVELDSATGQRRTNRLFYAMLVYVTLASFGSLYISVSTSVSSLLTAQTLTSAVASTMCTGWLLLGVWEEAKERKAAAENNLGWFSKMDWEITSEELHWQMSRDGEHFDGVLKWDALTQSLSTPNIIQLFFDKSSYTLARQMAVEDGDWEHLTRILQQAEQNLQAKQAGA